jgi:hypothetical protein
MKKTPIKRNSKDSPQVMQPPKTMTRMMIKRMRSSKDCKIKTTESPGSTQNFKDQIQPHSWAARDPEMISEI